MKIFLVAAALITSLQFLTAAEPAGKPESKPVLRITPGKVVIPYERMRRVWGELISLDLETRAGKFRNESTDEVMSFTVLPYAELLHHATLGDLQDFRAGERAVFRLHENESGQWVWLTYIQDEMNMMNGHKEYFYVDAIDREQGQLTCTQANLDQTFIREKGVVIQTDAETRYWKAGQLAKFSDIAVGDKVRTKTHGIGKGKVRVAWEVFLDDQSLLKFQTEQKAVHVTRIREEGIPGYVDQVSEHELRLTLFAEGGEVLKRLKPGKSIRVAPAGVNRKPTVAPVSGTVTSATLIGKQSRVSLAVTAPVNGFEPAQVARLWTTEE